MTDIETVRLLIGDRVKKAVNEEVGEGDGVQKTFQLDMYPLVTNPTAHVYLLQTGTTMATAESTFSASVGCVTFTSAPKNGHQLLATYEYHALSSGELSDILSGHTGEPYLAAANACLILAADASRLFMYTMGDKTVDKRRIASDLRELSKELEKRHWGMKKDSAYTGTVFTFKDDTGTPYEGYDAASAYITGTS